METLVVVAQHQHGSKPQGHARFGSSPSGPGDFRAINCRTFQAGNGIIATPFKSPVTKKPFSKAPSSPPNSTNKTLSKTSSKSTPIPIDVKPCKKDATFSEGVPDGSLLLSERWAGPTYSNSPPPSSLPIPKFPVRPKRTVSLHLPGSPPEIEIHPLAKSAPSSPRREHSLSTPDLFVNADSATKTLRRILNLNLDDE